MNQWPYLNFVYTAHITHQICCTGIVSQDQKGYGVMNMVDSNWMDRMMIQDKYESHW